jgi:hypothetical protein
LLPPVLAKLAKCTVSRLEKAFDSPKESNESDAEGGRNHYEPAVKVIVFPPPANREKRQGYDSQLTKFNAEIEPDEG